MAEKVGVAYDSKTGNVHRIYVPDNDSLLQDKNLAVPGEDFIIYDRQFGFDVHTAREQVARHLGVKP